MTGRDVNGARAAVHRYKIGSENDGFAIEERMVRFDSVDLCAWK